MTHGSSCHVIMLHLVFDKHFNTNVSCVISIKLIFNVGGVWIWPAPMSFLLVLLCFLRSRLKNNMHFKVLVRGIISQMKCRNYLCCSVCNAKTAKHFLCHEFLSTHQPYKVDFWTLFSASVAGRYDMTMMLSAWICHPVSRNGLGEPLVTSPILHIVFSDFYLLEDWLKQELPDFRIEFFHVL